MSLFEQVSWNIYHAINLKFCPCPWRWSSKSESSHQSQKKKILASRQTTVFLHNRHMTASIVCVRRLCRVIQWAPRTSQLKYITLSNSASVSEEDLNYTSNLSSRLRDEADEGWFSNLKTPRGIHTAWRFERVANCRNLNARLGEGDDARLGYNGEQPPLSFWNNNKRAYLEVSKIYAWDRLSTASLSTTVTLQVSNSIPFTRRNHIRHFI